MYTYLKDVDDALPMRETGAWAREKLDYLSRYIAVFEKSMRDKWRYRNYIDLQAGPGKNRVKETSEVFLGSPLLALTTEYPFTGYYFVEYDSEMARALQSRCAASALSDRVHITTGDCNQVVDDIVAALKTTERQSLNLAFLDPEGLELRWATVARLASINRMDLIINYPQGGLNRYMPIAIAQNEDTSVDLFFGTREWRTIYLEYLQIRGVGLHRQLIDLYKRNLATLGYEDVRRDDEVGDEPLIRNSRRNAPLYRLLFASKSALGEKFWRSITSRNIWGQRRLFDA
jgi:three-Cys-motif partner protein